MPSPNLNPNHIMKDVYSYPFPEVRDLVNSQYLPQEFMLNTLSVEEAADQLSGYAFLPAIELPARNDGSLDLDELHTPVLERIRKVLGGTMLGLEAFPHAYPTPGSSQSIFNLLAEWKATGKLESVAVLDGEYDGYAAYANTLRIPVNRYQTLGEAEPQTGEMWFVSNPNARDGDWIDTSEWKAFTEAGHQIVYDAAYVGLTPEHAVDISSPNVQAVLTSPSKVFGVFRNRYIGTTYTKDAVASMYGTKWFKSIPALLDTLQLYETFGLQTLPEKYRSVQEAICQDLSEAVDSEVIPSDTLLLAQSAGPVADDFEQFKRVDAYRFGLAKLFEDYER